MHNTEIRLDYRGKHQPPIYATSGAAGLDLSANIDHEIILMPGERRLLGTGLYVKFPSYIEMQIRSRSGLAKNYGVIVLNAPATIDSDYDGPEDEVGVLLYNSGDAAYHIQPGERIAQGVFNEVHHAITGFTKDTKRREGGYGSTGKV